MRFAAAGLCVILFYQFMHNFVITKYFSSETLISCLCIATVQMFIELHVVRTINIDEDLNCFITEP